MNPNRGKERGAALILEIIIYLVIVALIAVAVTSGVRAVRDLVFTSHAKGDVQNVQSWMEGKYSQDGTYPGGQGLNLATVPGSPVLTTANGVTNGAIVTSVNGSGAGYCITVYSHSISDRNKQRFWLTSTNPSKIMQGGTASMVPAGQYDAPPSSGHGVGCYF